MASKPQLDYRGIYTLDTDNTSSTLNYNNQSNKERDRAAEQKYIQAEIDKYKKLSKELSKEEKKRLDSLYEYARRLDKERIEESGDYQEEIEKKLQAIQEENDKKRLGKYKDIHDQIKDTWDSIKSNELLSKISGTIVNKLDPIIKQYIDSQTIISAHLSGSSSTLASITDRLHDSLSAQGLVRQEEVYKNLTNLVQSGIVYNVEQRAFLQTLKDDMGMIFDAQNGSLTRLIRLQQEDSSANRLALEYNLQKFLNESYQNSQYIRDAFTQVSDALIEMRAMNSNTGQGVENTLQTWLGALYSNGLSGNTATSLATAFNALGSGDISNLGQGISNLVLMGVARAGLDYGDILNSGLNANQTNQIMSGISTYLQEMGANSSHVVQSQLANIFGINVADILAARNTGVVNTTMNDNIGTLLNDFGGFVSLPKQFRNFMDNAMYTWGTNIASNPWSYGTYEIEKLVAPTLAPIIGGIFNERMGNLVAALPLLTLLPTLGQTIGDMIPSFASGMSGLQGIYSSLSNMVSKSTTVSISGGGVSGSAYIGNGDMSGMFSNTRTSALDIADSFNIEGTKEEWEDNVLHITENTTLMLELMQDTMTSIRDDVNYVRNDFTNVNAALQALASNFSGATSTLGSL